MIQTFIALLTEQKSAEMKYWLAEADVFYLKVLFTSYVKTGALSVVFIFLILLIFFPPPV